ncbi:EAL domain-containing protein [Ralstonia sp. 25C]|uniref:EAL domain-containing response regulator n=1 Tax=Ralstonia sp. 25C TaxID=3447363 RepID=UPI003F755625
MIKIAAVREIAAPPERMEPQHTMLLVDDNIGRREALAAMLDSLCTSEIVQADSVVAALAILARARADVVLCAPRISGHDAFDVVGLLSASGSPPLLGFIGEPTDGMVESGNQFAQSLGMTTLPAIACPWSSAALRTWLAAIPTQPHRRATSEPINAANKLRDSQVYMALEGGQFCAFFQPQIDVAKNTLAGFELLARWHSAPGVIRGPAYFFDALVRVGAERQLIVRLLEDAAWLTQRLRQPFSMSLNVSARTLIELDFVPFLQRAIAALDMKPEQFVIEVTESESVAEESLCLLAAAGHRLRLHGFGLSIDDFGTGYASLERVDMLPLTELKVDRRFLLGSEQRLQTRALLESCTALARRLGVRSVVEGVETEEDREIAREVGSDLAQGYLFAPPLSASAALTWALNCERGHVAVR